MSDSDLPSDIEEVATGIISSLLPEKSRAKYELAYSRYQKWCEEHKIKTISSEKALLAYFNNLSKVQKPSSLWAYYSMLRSVMSIRNNVEINKYSHLIAFLKRKSEGYRPTKSKILTKNDIGVFLQEADDNKFFMTKVALIVGIAGACRREELTNLLLQNVKDEGACFRIVLPFTKTKIAREFFVTSGDIEGIDMVEIVRNYIKLRPKNVDNGRFFLCYKNDRCTKQPVGINTFGGMPKTIALFLKLSNPEQYTGHCFRRSSTSLLANTGVDILSVKRHGGWRSNTVAEGYIEASEENKKKTALNILGNKENEATSIQKLNISNATSSQVLSSSSSTSGINLSNCNSCVINIYNK